MTRVNISTDSMWEPVVGYSRVVRVGSHIYVSGRAHCSFFGEIRPATSMVQVARLIDPDMLVEIEAEGLIEKT